MYNQNRLKEEFVEYILKKEPNPTSKTEIIRNKSRLQ